MSTSKIKMIVLGCLSMTAMTGALSVPSAQASTAISVIGRGVEYAQRIDPKDRFEFRDREEYFDDRREENRFDRYDRDRFDGNRRRQRVCRRLERSISYLSRIRENLRNNGEYAEARAVARELREQQYKYRQYCQN